MELDQGREVFRQPHEDQAIWRYLDLAKYLALVSSRSLHFARADTLDDQWEGSSSDPTQALLKVQHSDLPPEFFQQMKSMSKLSRDKTFISSWSASSTESAALWSLYSIPGQGIAIRSTWGKLTRALDVANNFQSGYVNYVNYEHSIIPNGNVLAPFMFKRESFKHEEEVRLVIFEGEVIEILEGDVVRRVLETSKMKFLSVPFDLNAGIEGIVVAPGTPQWIFDSIVRSNETFGVNAPVERSQLDNRPV